MFGYLSKDVALENRMSLRELPWERESLSPEERAGVFALWENKDNASLLCELGRFAYIP